MTLRWDDWQLDIPARRIEGPDGPVHVEPQVFDVLAYLVDHRDRVVPKEELLDEVWGDQFVSESALTSRIKSVRKALGDDGRRQMYVRNVHGRGYQFVGRVDGAAMSSRATDSVTELDVALAVSVDDEYPFVGRTDEIDRIHAAVSEPGMSLVFIGGEPGIGKSRLAVEALQRLSRDGNMVCAARCEEQVTYALQPVRDAVAQLAGSRPSEFAGWAAGIEPQLVGLMPSLVTLLSAEPVVVDGYSALEALTTLIQRAADTRPVTMLVDDLHWSDEPTRAFVARLNRRLAGRPISVLLTYRSTSSDLPREVHHWIADQTRRARTLTVDLEGLQPDDARQLIAAVLGEESSALADELVAHTRGHGLFLTESLRDVQHGGTSASSVQMMVSTRLGRLAEPVRNIVRAGALLGPEFSFELAAAGANLGEEEALAAIDEAVAAELLHETASPSRFRFSHAMVPSAIKATMSRRASAVIHHRCAEALIADGADDVEISFHLLGAVPLVEADEAITRSCRAIDEALDNNEFDRGIRLIERVLEASPDERTKAQALLQKGWALVAGGRAAAAVPTFEQAAELGRQHGWTEVIVEAAMGHYGRSPYRKLGDTSTLQLLAEADGLLGDEPSIAKARVLAKTAAFSLFTLPLRTCDEMTRHALEMAQDAEPPIRMELLELRFIVFACPAGVAELERLQPELTSLREQDGVWPADAAAPENHLLMLHRGDELRAIARSDEVRLKRQPIAEWRDLALNMTLATFAGEYQRARRLCDEAGSIGDQFWGDSSQVLHALGHGFLGALDGELDRALELFDRLLERANNQYVILPAAWAFAAAGAGSRAEELIAGIKIENFRWHGEHVLGGNALIAAAEVALLTDRDDLAEAAETHLRPFENLLLGVPWAPSLAAADSLSRLARRRGDRREAQRYAEIARNVYVGIDAPALQLRLDDLSSG